MDISWNDATEYLRWLSRRTGKRYRLPTEAEWEYAARAGSMTRFPWGDKVGSGKAVCDKCGTKWDDRRTAPVGSFPPNAFGLYDMAGNLWEWVADCWHDSYKGAPTDGSAWNTGGECEKSIPRGGSWDYGASHLRPADRGHANKSARLNVYGMRVARDLDR